jgi:hypothetical protein
MTRKEVTAMAAPALAASAVALLVGCRVLKGKTLGDAKPGDLFIGPKSQHVYRVLRTGAESGLSAIDLTTGKASSPWSYGKPVDLYRPEAKSDETLIERTWGILVGIALRRGTITYTNLSEVLGLNMNSPWDRWKLGVILGGVADRSHSEWGILLPAIAVGGKDGLPSGRRDPANPSGFYAWCAANGISINDPRKLVENEQRKVFKFFGV